MTSPRIVSQTVGSRPDSLVVLVRPDADQDDCLTEAAAYACDVIGGYWPRARWTDEQRDTVTVEMTVEV